MYQRRPFRPGKFGLRRGKTNDESSAKMMKSAPVDGQADLV